PLRIGRCHRSIVGTGGKVRLAKAMPSPRTLRISLAHAGVVAGLEAFAFVLEGARAPGQRPMDRKLGVRFFDLKRSRCRVYEIRYRSTRRDRLFTPDFHLRGRWGLSTSGR